MSIPPPKVGQIINFSYLWAAEAEQGELEGRKDRPCALILTFDNDRVAVAPITHTPHLNPSLAIEIPPAFKKQAGLDDARAWVITSEINYFAWPGFDVRPARDGWLFGTIPEGFRKQIVQAVLANDQLRRLKKVRREE